MHNHAHFHRPHATGDGNRYKGIWRWAFAFIAVTAAFAIPAWLCGMFLLTEVLKDAHVRWLVATAVGIAVVAFVALWAHGFVADRKADESPNNADMAGAGNIRNIIEIKGGLFLGPVIQGRKVTYNAAIPPPEQADK